ncbi:MAG: DUF4339 domain-containing protein [Thermodesulfobacteriota bacterium]
MSDNLWFYQKDKERIGPLSEGEMKELFERGELTGDSIVWTRGLKKWVRAATIKEFEDSYW